MPTRPELVADIAFGLGGEAEAHVLDGWGEAEIGHRWSIGRESRVQLPIRPEPGCIVIVDAAPWCDPASLPAQTVMFALNGRLLLTVTLTQRRVLAMTMPASIAGDAPAVLSIIHLNGNLPRLKAGVYRDGQPLGLSITSLRLFRGPPMPPVVTRPAIAASDVAARTGLAPGALVTRFENLGHDCEFGTVQRNAGVEPLGLLRFAGLVTHKLVDGLMARFDGVGAPQTTRVFLSDPPFPEWKLHEQRYYLWYSVGKKPNETTQDSVLREQCRRLVFLQRKFVEDLRLGEKIFVLTRGEVLTEPEALAVFCALQIEGPNTLLWTVHGDPRRTGEVDCLMPGLLRGHLGTVDDRNYATQDAWLSVLGNAQGFKQSFFEKKDQKTSVN
jgi:hypothetical protein